MKNLFFRSVLFLGMVTIVVACSEEETPTPAPTIVGKWGVTSRVINVKLGTNVLQSDSTAYAAGEADFEFVAPKTVIAKMDGTTDTVDYYYANGKLMFIDYDPIDGYDTTVFNKVNLSANALMISMLDTMITPSGNLVSEFTVRMTK